MKIQNIIPVSAILLTILMASCSKDGTNSSLLNSAGNQANSNKGLSAVAQPVVNLGTAGNFVILSQSGITDVYKSTITGDVGTSPITGAALLLTSAEVTGKIYTVDAAGPLPTWITNAPYLTQAVLDMQAAYLDAAGRIYPDYLNLGAGLIGGLTLTPGLYKWTSTVAIPTDITISGGPNDVFIFQVAGTLTMAPAVKVTLVGGAQAKNIFWQVSGAVTFGTTSHFEGNVLGATGINLQTGATLNGRMLAQTAVTLEMNTVTIAAVTPPVVLTIPPVVILPAIIPAVAQPVINLGTAGNFVILSKAGITDVYKSTITGDVGTSPITGAALLLTSAEVTGNIYTVDAAGPLPTRITNAPYLTLAVLDMQAAYLDAAGRINPDYLNLGAGLIGGLTLTPGLYKWTSTVAIPTDITISGGPNDVFIFQVAGTLTMAPAVKVTLVGGAQAKNIFWQVSGAVTFGTTSHFEGNVLGATGINLQTGATLNGTILAQTDVTLQMNTVTKAL